MTAIDEPNAGYHTISHHRLGKIYRPTNQAITAAFRQAQTLDVIEFFDDIMIGSKSRVTLAKFLDLLEAVNHARQDFCDTCETRHAMPLLTPDIFDEDEYELRNSFSHTEKTAESRVLIITDTGHIGFAPISSKVGD